MSNKSSLINWGGLLILLFLAAAAPLWSLVAEHLSGPEVRIAPEPQIIEINLPMSVAGADSVSLTGLQAAAVLGGIVVAVVVGAGVVLTFAYAQLSKQVTTVTESEEYQSQTAALAELDRAKTIKLRNNRTAGDVPEHKMPRWSVLSTSLLILLLVLMSAMLINSTFVPSGEYLNDAGEIASSAMPIVGGSILIALLVLFLRMRPQALNRFEETDNDPIPWDAVWVILTGMLVVGLGIGFVVYLNLPG